jgi:general stress protein 26
MTNELDKFYGLIDDIIVAMLTTRRPDGHLESRAISRSTSRSRSFSSNWQRAGSRENVLKRVRRIGWPSHIGSTRCD